MTRLTAKEARNLSLAKNPDHIADQILEMIKEQAENGRTHLHLRSFGFGDHTWYGNALPEYLVDVIKILRSLGYSVKHTFDESQLVDVYLKIEW